jgi:hypothetical protein
MGYKLRRLINRKSSRINRKSSRINRKSSRINRKSRRINRKSRRMRGGSSLAAKLGEYKKQPTREQRNAILAHQSHIDVLKAQIDPLDKQISDLKQKVFDLRNSKSKSNIIEMKQHITTRKMLKKQRDKIQMHIVNSEAEIMRMQPGEGLMDPIAWQRELQAAATASAAAATALAAAATASAEAAAAATASAEAATAATATARLEQHATEEKFVYLPAAGNEVWKEMPPVSRLTRMKDWFRGQRLNKPTKRNRKK